MAYVLDIVLLLLFALCIRSGYKRGIIKSVIKLVLLFASVMLAKVCTGMIAPALAESLPLPGIGTKLASYINVNISRLEDASISDLLTGWGFPQKAADGIESFVDSTASSANESITRTISPALDSFLTQIIVFVFLLLIFWLVSLLISALIDKALELPVLSGLNHIAGLAVGAAIGIISLFLIAFIVSWAFPLIDASLDLNLTESISEKSILLRFLNSINPFAGLLS